MLIAACAHVVHGLKREGLGVQVVARTKVYHCNFIPEVGLVYLPILWDKWSPAQGITKVLLGIVEILKNPDVGTQQHSWCPRLWRVLFDPAACTGVVYAGRTERHANRRHVCNVMVTHA